MALHLAVGLVARRRHGRRVSVEARLVGATLGEGWAVMGDLLTGLRPGLVLVGGEEELSTLAAERFPGAAALPVAPRPGRLLRRPLHRPRQPRARQRRSTPLLINAYRDHDLDAARAAHAELIADADACGARAATAHLRAATEEVFTFLTHPGAGRLLFGDKGRARTRHRRARTRHARDEPPHRHRRVLISPRRPSHPHGQCGLTPGLIER